MSGKTEFDWQDPLRLDEELTGDERMIRDTAHAFAQQELAPGIIAANRAGHFDRNILRQMGELGLLGVTLPSEYGGAEASYVILRPDRPRDRAGRQRLPLGHERAVLARHASDLSPTARKTSARSICRAWPAANWSAASA
jgi:alkylation response protein AidB-like acyl-CoA dehydrogenase